MKQTKLINEQKQAYEENLDELNHLDDTAFDHRTKTGIRAYLNKVGKLLRGQIAWEDNHLHY